ncbi:MAG: 2-phospho-L-lactate transferase [Candidatus Heimdallarchaeota archaeon]|nr:2-phospho-L-lactate transferase [Candidatus Heimdallarchaeota archaeon]
MEYTLLSGGTGTPKLLQGLRELVADKSLTVIANGGDDTFWHSLRVCPDLDTLIYLFSDQLDLKKFWGVKEETFETLMQLKSLGVDEWFNIGNKDLALHLYRNELLQRFSLTQTTKLITDNWGIEASILPMSDEFVQTRILTEKGTLSFQEFFVKFRTEVEVRSVEYMGNKTKTTPEVLHALKNPLIIGPSNPITSIGPILSIDPIKNHMMTHHSNNVAVSPITGNQAFSGPTIKLMKANGIPTSPVGLAAYYQDLVSILILDESDRSLAAEIKDYDIEPVFLPILLSNKDKKIQLAKDILNIL